MSVGAQTPLLGSTAILESHPGTKNVHLLNDDSEELKADVKVISSKSSFIDGDASSGSLE